MFPVFAIMSKADMNIQVQLFLKISFLFEKSFRFMEKLQIIQRIPIYHTHHLILVSCICHN